MVDRIDWKGFETMRCSYYDLENATPEELLEAYIFEMKRHEKPGWQADYYEALIRAGFGLAQPDGWQRVAPASLREYRQEKESER